MAKEQGQATISARSKGISPYRQHLGRPPRHSNMAGFCSLGREIWYVSLDRPLLDTTNLKVLPTQDTDVLYLKLLTTDFIVLNSTEAITDLCEKRSNIYCDRVSPLGDKVSFSLMCTWKTSRTCRCSSCKLSSSPELLPSLTVSFKHGCMLMGLCSERLRKQMEKMPEALSRVLEPERGAEIRRLSEQTRLPLPLSSRRDS